MLSHRGRKLPRFDAVQSVYEFVAKYEEELTLSEEIYDEIGFATYAMNHRHIPGDFDDSGKILKPIKIIMMQAEYGVLGMLLANGYNPKPLALEKVTLKEMKKLRTIFFHNRGAILKADYTKLIDYVKAFLQVHSWLILRTKQAVIKWQPYGIESPLGYFLNIFLGHIICSIALIELFGIFLSDKLGYHIANG